MKKSIIIVIIFYNVYTKALRNWVTCISHKTSKELSQDWAHLASECLILTTLLHMRGRYISHKIQWETKGLETPLYCPKYKSWVKRLVSWHLVPDFPYQFHLRVAFLWKWHLKSQSSQVTEQRTILFCGLAIPGMWRFGTHWGLMRTSCSTRYCVQLNQETVLNLGILQSTRKPRHGTNGTQKLMEFSLFQDVPTWWFFFKDQPTDYFI